MENPPPLSELVRVLQAAIGALSGTPIAQEMARIGSVLLVSIATILLVWRGLRMMFTRFDLPVEVFAFAKLLLAIAATESALVYYERPLPGLGVSFTDLILGQAQRLTDVLTYQALEDVQRGLADLWQRLEPADPFALLQNLLYWVLLVLIGIAQAVVLFITAFGLIASAVCLVIGPLFIPFVLIPTLDWVFWGWLKAFVQYSFMQVIAQLFIYLFGTYVLAYLTQVPAGLTVEGTLLWALYSVMVLASFALGILMVPALTSSIFSGQVLTTGLIRPRQF